MERTWMVAGGGLALLLAGSAVAVAQSAPPVGSGKIGHVRIEAASRAGWAAVRGSDFAGIPIFFRRKVRTPRTADRVDVTMTLTGSFRTSSTDHGEVTADVVPPAGRGKPMAPGSLKVQSPTATTASTTSMTWISRRLSAHGKEYVFGLEAQAFDGPDGNQWARFHGGKRSIVIEMWPAGR